jgi:hypothetical protein
MYIQPSSKRQNDIIQLTAERASNQPQFEVFLKVKEENNPDFAFLYPESKLHSYYSWLKGRNGAIVQERPESRSSSSSSERKDGLGGLLAGYGSSSSSSTSDGEESIADGTKIQSDGATEAMGTTTGVDRTGTCNGDDNVAKDSAQINTKNLETEEKRAKRLKKAKAHFESKLLAK